MTANLIESGICIDQNFPKIKEQAGDERLITFGESEGLSITLRNVPYADAYLQLTSERSFNMRLIDGGLLQMLYHFKSGSLIKHRLAFFPSPDLLEYQNNPDVYEEDELYADVIHRNVVTVPIRFDFDPASFVEDKHPKSHLTLGQYKNCRIPVSSPLTPYGFTTFILKAFYNTPYRNLSSALTPVAERFNPTIAGSELRQVHINVWNEPSSAPTSA